MTGPAKVGILVSGPEKNFNAFTGLARKGMRGMTGRALEPPLIIEREVFGHRNFLRRKHTRAMARVMKDGFAGISNRTVMAGKAHLR
jgi:hypothetical protein